MTELPAKPVSLMLVCGEPSGDQLGGELMAGLKALEPSVRITGVGGAAMEAQGLTTLFPLDDTAVMGLREVVPKIPVILRRVTEAVDFVLQTRPDAVVLIDSPDFTHRIARRLKRIDHSIVTINYVAPQVWASRSYRARAMAHYFDLVLALLPFEPAFFESYGLKAVFVGHPVIERAARMTGGDVLRARLGIAADAPLLAVLPGSRTSEVRPLLPIFRDAVARLAKDVPGLVCVLPTVAHVAARVRAGTADWPVPLHVLEGEAGKFAALDAADAALAATGTVTTELALAKTPMVAAYRLGWLTHALMRPLIHAPYATLVNIILGREAVPEFIQRDCTPDNLARALGGLFRDPEARATQLRDLDAAVRELGAGGEAPSLRAARALLAFLRERRGTAAT
jgi:lipid-A-disaccharide synthase